MHVAFHIVKYVRNLPENPVNIRNQYFCVMCLLFASERYQLLMVFIAKALGLQM